MFSCVIFSRATSAAKRRQITHTLLEDGMSPSSNLRKGCVAFALLVAAVLLISSSALAQSDSTPKWDLFVGYQWLDPGGTVPAPGGNSASPTPFQLPNMAKGLGGAVTYN